VKESIWIQKEPNCMNRDRAAYSLPTANDRFWSHAQHQKPDKARHWLAKRCN